MEPSWPEAKDPGKIQPIADAVSHGQHQPVQIHSRLCASAELAGRGCEKASHQLEANVPVAIAPSGGYTHQGTTRNIVPTTLPSLAELLQKRGMTLKIVPSIVKERPPVCHGTYKKYIADRILPYRLFRLLLARLKIKRYSRPRLTVEFLPPVTFPHIDSSKDDKIRFVQELQKIMYGVLNRD
jgi:hypothetical protein